MAFESKLFPCLPFPQHSAAHSAAQHDGPAEDQSREAETHNSVQKPLAIDCDHMRICEKRRALTNRTPLSENRMMELQRMRAEGMRADRLSE